MNSITNHPELLALHKSISEHSMYNKILTVSDLKIMMETHIFAVWDFMSLLKRLQREITCVELPWKPSPYPGKIVRLINEIVLGEESDLDQNGEAIDHFSLYLKAMNEIGAKTSHLKNFIADQDFSKLTNAQRNFVQFHLNLANAGLIHEVAASFFFGREKLIPDMFTSIITDLEKNIEERDQDLFPNLKYYLLRHIEIDGTKHGSQAEECLAIICGNDEKKWEEARLSGVKSLKLRIALWDEVESSLI
ncbi:MAG: DUF3050 domain-containing protein [Bacteriovorax sp.]|nr:DUF3050 domain-containing protein [Bacteriovorax sp.]